jgi:beta-galactosidase
MSTFNIRDNEYLLDGQPFRILSGAIHYFRVPRAYWDDRLEKARLMGLNTIETYAAWNLHESHPGEFHFDGNLDVAAFVQAAARHDLKVIFRPGPYICSEWDFGGLPAWLLKDPQMRVRCSYPPFLEAVDRFFKALLPQLAPLQVAHGGPILMVQIENEYGSYGDDKTYLAYLRDSLRRNGIDVLLFTSDGELGSHLQAGMLENIHATINFGGSPKLPFQALRRNQPCGPLMCTEFWDGWFDFWGIWHQTRSAARTARNLERILKAGASVNLYMWHGGTSFGFMNGANIYFGKYMPIISSYDYDAPLSESGELTKKYHALRKVISKVAPVPDQPLSAPKPKLNLKPVPVTEGVSLWQALPSLSIPIHLPAPEPMEFLDQNHGFILYRTHLKGPQTGKLSIIDLHDRAQISVDGQELGILQRNQPHQALEIRIPDSGACLDILVENMGRLNFGPSLVDRKGILGGVLMDGHYLFDWEVFCLPLEDLSKLKFNSVSAPMTGPAFYRAEFNVDQPLDTFLNLPGWTKGAAWVNGFNLGRYWKIGPQRSLYVPAPVLKPGTNELVIFELHGTKRMQAVFRSRP